MEELKNWTSEKIVNSNKQLCTLIHRVHDSLLNKLIIVAGMSFINFLLLIMIVLVLIIRW